MGRKSNRQKELERKLMSKDLGEVLNAFADIANETRGCSFTIYKTQRDRIWKVNLQNIVYEGFQDYDLRVALREAAVYILKRRRRTKGVYYTMW